MSRSKLTTKSMKTLHSIASNSDLLDALEELAETMADDTMANTSVGLTEYETLRLTILKEGRASGYKEFIKQLDLFAVDERQVKYKK